MSGQKAYEADVARQPTYHDGKPRKAWHELGEVEQWSWNRPQNLCEDCPPADYPTDATRCTPCPRRGRFSRTSDRRADAAYWAERSDLQGEKIAMYRAEY